MAGRRNRDMIPDNDSDNSQRESQDEAIEENMIVEEEDRSVSDEGDGDDLFNNMEEDYKPVPELDQYEVDGIDDEVDYEEMDFEERRQAEEELRDRDYERDAYQKRIPNAMKEFDIEDDDDLDLRNIRRKLYIQEECQESYDGEEDTDKREDDRYLDREYCRGKLATWIKEPPTVRYIRRKFRYFLTSFKDDNQRPIYKGKIIDMCSKNKNSLEIDLQQFEKQYDTIGMWIMTEPNIIIPYLNDVALECAQKQFPSYSEIHDEVFVRFDNFPVTDQIRNLRHKDLGQLIQVRAVITHRSPIFSQLKKVSYICKCGKKSGTIILSTIETHNLGTCPYCLSTGPFSIDQEATIYRNFQRMTIQEPPGSVPPGRVPRQKEIIALGDNIDIARPGDEVDVTGIFQHRYDYILNVKHGFPVFSTIIESNFIKRTKEGDQSSLAQSIIDEIKKLSQRKDITQLIKNSIAPSIHQHQHVKMALALAMFGGVHKDIQGKHRIRGDINVLLLGDPGVAKSQFLKSVEKTFHRCVFTTGKGASAVGLTASVRKDPQTKEWTLQGGALVLADKGICLIDEFDKMNDHDRTSIHEAMEQQSISISKVGIVANLQARCSVIAAANPIKGRYDSQLSFMDNVNLTDPILSRFDILCVIKDEVDRDLDFKLAGFVVNSHIKNHPLTRRDKNDEPEKHEEFLQKTLLEESEKQVGESIPSETLRNYIQYARQHVHPKLSDIKVDKIKSFYSELRQESTITGGINIAVRHIESIIRMAEAHAKMHLREIVRDEDVDEAINVMLESFVQSQKYSVASMIKSKYSKYMTKSSDNNFILYKLLDRITKEHTIVLESIDKKKELEGKIPVSHFEHQAKDQYKISLFEDFYNSELFKKYFIKQDKNIIRKN